MRQRIWGMSVVGVLVLTSFFVVEFYGAKTTDPARGSLSGGE